MGDQAISRALPAQDNTKRREKEMHAFRRYEPSSPVLRALDCAATGARTFFLSLSDRCRYRRERDVRLAA
jgi:hypothetical protein